MRDFASLFRLERSDLIYDGLARLIAFADLIAEVANVQAIPESAEKREAAEWQERTARATDVRRALTRLQRIAGLARPSNTESSSQSQSGFRFDAETRIDPQDVTKFAERILAEFNKSANTQRTDSSSKSLKPSCRTMDVADKMAPLINDVADDLESFHRCQNAQDCRTDLDFRTHRQTPGGSNDKSSDDQALSEPYVSFLGPDLVGLALSGGGIRSATFNLGLLQGLHFYRVLDLVDYLSTVSGGGYIGGWWSAWRKNANIAGQPFPDRLVPESPLVRHLREFSNFLSPRVSLFSVDLWYGLISIIGGLLPTLILAALLLVTVVMAWCLAASLILFFVVPVQANSESTHAAYSGFVVFLFTLVIQLVCEFLARRPPSHLSAARSTRKAAPGADEQQTSPILAKFARMQRIFRAVVRYFPAATIAASVSAIATYYITPHLIRAGDSGENTRLLEYLTDPVYDWSNVHWILLSPTLAWIAAGVAILLARALLGRIVASILPCTSSADWLSIHARISRSVSRLFVPALIWFVFWALWEISLWILGGAMSLWTVGWTAALGAELFRRLRNWMSFRPSEAQSGNFVDLIRPYVPQVIAYGVLTCALILASAAVATTLKSMESWEPLLLLPLLTFACPAAFLAICWLMDPHAHGLHDFYRGRIARTYLGASNPAKELLPANRSTFEHPGDDFPIDQFQGLESRRPIHLVCCAANDLAGDEIESLGRCARSATLSRFGISLANAHRETPGLSFASALTASAAAFNSQMGSLSGGLGPAVAFLLTALNLRLGRWIEHPAWKWNDDHPAPARAPSGTMLLREFLSWTHSGVDAESSSFKRFVHLSDGAHFENLGLYELVRRHCRYIIVSDCGADPEYAFDDIGNALRRIREDFGVEIEIDVSALKPSVPGGAALQHVVVGTIHYDDQYDKGVLLVFKPNLTGDEPDDVDQYRTRNKAFPQETTADQFYDEAQWESYRRLGEHAAHSALRFLERKTTQQISRYQVFTDACYHWYPTPAGLSDRMLQYTARYSKYLEILRQSGCDSLTPELFAELGAGDGLPREIVDKFDLTKTIPLLLQMGQILEDIFVGLQLDQTWSHPLNSGWMSLFSRWTGSLTFRAVWPFMQPLYSREFRLFLNDRFNMSRFSPGDRDRNDLKTWVRKLVAIDQEQGLALAAWRDRFSDAPDPLQARRNEEGDVKVFTLKMPIPMEGQQFAEIQLALGRVRLCKGDNATIVAHWNTDDLILVPWLCGVNIASAFIDVLIHHLTNEEKVTRIEVCFDGRRPPSGSTPSSTNPPETLRTDHATRSQRADLVRTYKSLGFKLFRRLGPSKRSDDLEQYLVRELR